MKRTARRLAPWVVTGGILAYLLQVYPADKIAAEMAQGNTLAMVPFAVLALLVSFFTIAIGDNTVIRHATTQPIGWWAVARGKAATAVMMSLGMSFGAGAYGVWISRRTQTPARETVGIIGYLMLTDLCAVCVLGAGAVWFVGDGAIDHTARDALRLVAPTLAVVLALVALVGPRFLGRFVDDPRLLKPWAKVPPTSFAINLALRLGNLATLTLATWLASQAFGLRIPLLAMAAYFPIIMLVGALPINIAGFGAVQGVWLAFFVPRWASGEQLLAFQVLWHLVAMVALLGRGAPFLGRVVQDIAEGKTSGASDHGVAASDRDDGDKHDTSQA